MNHQTKLVTLALVLLFSALSFAAAQSVPWSAKKALAATVSLEVQDENGVTRRRGSGFFVRRNLIATNFHVIKGAARVRVTLVNTKTTYYIEDVTAIDESNDLALVKVTAEGVTPLPLGNSDTVRIGDTVYVTDNPRWSKGTASDGTIIGRRHKYRERLQMDIPISRSGMGGPVLNRHGEVIGVSVSADNPLKAQDFNFATPSNALKALLTRSRSAKPSSHGKPSVQQGKRKTDSNNSRASAVTRSRRARASSHGKSPVQQGKKETNPVNNHVSAQSVPQLAKKALATTVSLEVRDGNGITLGRGSGFFVRRNLIATNFHVIDGAALISVKLVNTKVSYSIEGVTAIDEPNDLALLKVPVYDVTPLPLSDSDTVQVGETVYVAGNPKGLEGTFSDGIVSGRRDRYMGKERLQMTAPISPGSSGVPVLNRNGAVIGVSVSGYNPLYGQNLNFAIPSNALKALLLRSGRAKPLSHGKPSISADTYFQRGNEKLSSDNFKGAIKDFTQAIRLKPDNASYYYSRGVAKANLEQHFAAIADFDMAIRLRPEYAEAYYIRGLTKGTLGQHFAAIADFDMAIRLRPKYAEAYYIRGLTKGKLEQHFAAIADFDMAIRLRPEYAEAYYIRGLTKGKLGQHFAAITDFDTVIRLRPKHVDAYRSRGLTKVGLGQYTSAVADYDTAIHLDPDDAGTFHMRGMVKGKLSRFSAARRDLRTALKLAKRAGDWQLQIDIEESLQLLQQMD